MSQVLYNSRPLYQVNSSYNRFAFANQSLSDLSWRKPQRIAQLIYLVTVTALRYEYSYLRRFCSRLSSAYTYHWASVLVSLKQLEMAAFDTCFTQHLPSTVSSFVVAMSDDDDGASFFVMKRRRTVATTSEGEKRKEKKRKRTWRFIIGDEWTRSRRVFSSLTQRFINVA